MSRTRPDILRLALLGLTVAFSGALLWTFRDYTADDAFIYLRYVANLIENGELVFNLGERVTTLTSPLVTAIDAALHAALGEARVSYKVVSVMLLAAACLVVWRAIPTPEVRVPGLAVLAAAPAMAYWTVGGMEVAPLTLLVAAASALAVRVHGRTPVAVTFLAGLAFLARFDSAPFMTVLVVSALFRASWGVRLRALLVGAALPVAWLAFSQVYYGDIFPTSFYIKSPRMESSVLRVNAWYLAQGLLLTGAAPLLLWVVMVRLARRSATVADPDPPARWLAVAIVCQLAYGATMATVHMMFGFRALLPYLPALVILAGRLADPLTVLERRRFVRIAFAAFVLLLLGFQGQQAMWTRDHSVQGFCTEGELRKTSVTEMTHAIEGASHLPDLIRAHWASLKPTPTRPPRVVCGMEGVIPYNFREAYFFGLLVSYRKHGAAEFDWADYTVLPFPDGAQVPLREVAAVAYEFEGIRWRISAMYNANAKHHLKLPARVDDPDPN